jgi:hypothetical protein
MEPGFRIRVRCQKQFRYFPMSLRTRHALPCPARHLRSFLRVTDAIVDLQPLERCGLCRIEPEFPDRFAEEFAFFRMVVETACLYLFGPSSDFLRRFLLAASIVNKPR